MPKKRYKAEEIIHKLREADVLLAQGKTVAEVCKALAVTDQTCCRWRESYGGYRPPAPETLLPREELPRQQKVA